MWINYREILTLFQLLIPTKPIKEEVLGIAFHQFNLFPFIGHRKGFKIGKSNLVLAHEKSLIFPLSFIKHLNMTNQKMVLPKTLNSQTQR